MPKIIKFIESKTKMSAERQTKNTLIWHKINVVQSATKKRELPFARMLNVNVYYYVSVAKNSTKCINIVINM